MPAAQSAPENHLDTVRISSFEELLEMVGEHSVAAFAELYHRTSSKVLAGTRCIVRDHNQADEVTQEVYLEIWRLAGTFDRSLGSAASWINRIAHSRSVDRVRAVAAIRARDVKYTGLNCQPDIDVVIEDILRRADARDLNTAMARLTDLQRNAVTLTYLQGYSNREASVILQIPLPTLKTRIRDGLKSLNRQPLLTQDTSAV